MQLSFLLLFVQCCIALSFAQEENIYSILRKCLSDADRQLDEDHKDQKIIDWETDTQKTCEKAKREQRIGDLLQRCTEILQKQGADVLKKASELPENEVEFLIQEIVNNGTRGKRDEFSDTACYPEIECSQVVDRPITGRCNNMKNSEFGAALSPFRRILSPQYDNSVGNIRTASSRNSSQSQRLPSARVISNKIFKEDKIDEVVDSNLNNFFQQFGQFVAHDMVLTPVSTGKGGADLDCTICDDKRNENCAPIEVPEDDEYFTPKGCIRFTRALNAQKSFGLRKQINQNTHFLDLSTVYGNDDCVAKRVRSTGGKMKISQELGYPTLPQDPMDPNCQSTPKFPCFLAGDLRNTLHPALHPIHLYFIVLHNQLVEDLESAGANTTDEALYQEARRINIAIYQKFVYEQYLPRLIGPVVMRRFGLGNPSNISYNPNQDASLSAEFSTAGFRLHSTSRTLYPRLNNVRARTSEPVNLGSNTFYANEIYNLSAGHHETIMHGMLYTPQLKCDEKMGFAIRNQIFEQRGKKGSGVDIAAFNVQRARDFGVPSYNQYRPIVGLRRVVDFTDLEKEMSEAKVALLNKTFLHVDDIDLWVGMVMEKPVTGGIVGPTAAFIIGEQFAATKAGDRFWWEHDVLGTKRFRTAQKNAIRAYDLRNAICTTFSMGRNTSISSPTLPRDLFSYNSPSVHCAAFPPMDVTSFV